MCCRQSAAAVAAITAAKADAADVKARGGATSDPVQVSIWFRPACKCFTPTRRSCQHGASCSFEVRLLRSERTSNAERAGQEG